MSQHKKQEKNSKHPITRNVKVIMVDGSHKMIRMVYPYETLQLEIDPNTHRAWRKVTTFRKSNRAEMLKERFGGDF